METLKNPGFNFPVISGFAAIIFTGMLLIFVAGLSEIKPTINIEPTEPVIIKYTRPPELLDPVKEEEFEPKPIDPFIRDNYPDRMPQPVIPFTDTPEGIQSPNGIKIPIIPKDNQLPIRPGIGIFTPRQVDRPPRILKSVPPLYPFDAKTKGVEGRVVLRFVIDENGQILNPQIVKAEPEGIFEESALSALAKYKFEPAVIGSKKVKCYVVLPMSFRLN